MSAAIDWEGIKRDFSKGRLSVQMLAEKHSCHPDTIRKRAKKEAWQRHAATAVTDGKSCAEKVPLEDALEEITGEHRRLWRDVKKKFKNGLRTRDLKEGLEKLKAAKTAGEVLTIVVKGERQAWGLDEYGSGKLPDDTEEIVEAMASLTVPSGADKVMDGE